MHAGISVRRLRRNRTAGNMPTFTLLLIVLTVSGHSYVLQPSLTVTEVGLLGRNGKGDEVEGTQALESHTELIEVEKSGETLDGSKKTVVTDKPRHKVEEEEEKEGMLVAGLHLQMEHREKFSSHGQETEEDKGGNEESNMERLRNAKNELAEREKEDHKVVNNLTPPPSTTGQEAQTMFPTTKPATANHSLVSSEAHDRGTSFSPFEELNREVLQSPAHRLRINNELKGQISHRETHATQEADQLKTSGPIREVQAATPKTTLDLTTTNPKTREPSHIQKSSQNSRINATESAGKIQSSERLKNKLEVTAMQNQNFPAQPHVTKPSVEMQLAAVVAASMKQVKGNQTSEKKNTDKLKKKKKDNRTQKRAKTGEVAAPTHFPYFLDDYCPPECACYGRVVQCSDKGVDRFPYGIPYNSRYVLLMNNHISSIQLDLLDDYESMEFLVLSNNRLTVGSIEGAFEGIPALKRLYLDRNLLVGVPTDLPLSLEELRLDGNQVSVMSEAAWAQCPGLLVLSLSNNSLGNGSDSLPSSVFSPLTKLKTLNLDHNQLASVPLGLPLSIKELYLRGNHIGHFREGAFNGVSELMVLDLSANRLSNKGLLKNSLLNATHLESLNLEGNRLKQVPQYLPRSLKTLNLEGNLISSIRKTTLRTLKHLEHLGLARNKIFKVAPGAFKALPVLHQLDLCNNSLRQVPRELPQGLHSVVLTHNRIQSVPRDAFCWGDKSLSLSGLVRVQLEHNLIDIGKLDSQAFRCLRGFQVVHFY